MTVFISRSLSATSEFRHLLTAQGWQVTGHSLVTLSALPFAALPAADWIFFSSQNAVRFFFQQVDEPGINVPIAQWAALGAATARELQDYVGAVDFIGSGEPISTAIAFQMMVPVANTGITVVFPGARHSQQSVQRLLADVVQGIHLEVYDNCPVANPVLRSEKVLVFTSPLNAEAYLVQHTLQPDQRVVAIGETTASALRRLGVESYRVAAAPTEAALAQAVLAW